MKQVIILIAVLLIQIGECCVAQVVNFSPSVDEKDVGDASIQDEFDEYLDFMLSYDSDTILHLDPSLSYIIKYLSYHEVNLPQDFDDSLYLDTLKLICTSNPTSVQDSILKLTFLDTDTLFVEQTRLTKDDSSALKVFTFRKVNATTGEPYFGAASFYFDAEVSRLLSFNSGQYLVIAETRFTPDIRGSMPPGTSMTLYLEVIK
jgi:hypothetical protein